MQAQYLQFELTLTFSSCICLCDTNTFTHILTSMYLLQLKYVTFEKQRIFDTKKNYIYEWIIEILTQKSYTLLFSVNLFPNVRYNNFLLDYFSVAIIFTYIEM